MSDPGEGSHSDQLDLLPRDVSQPPPLLYQCLRSSGRSGGRPGEGRPVQEPLSSCNTLLSSLAGGLCQLPPGAASPLGGQAPPHQPQHRPRARRRSQQPHRLVATDHLTSLFSPFILLFSPPASSFAMTSLVVGTKKRNVS